jgi:recombination protein RecR
MDSLHRLEELFTHFPGIGPRQARRFVYYLLGRSPASIQEFIKLIEEVRKATSECPQCHRLFVVGPTSKNAHGMCSICSDTSRDSSTLMIVARDSDFESIEKSGVYKGLYFILGGTVPILDKEPEKRIRLKALLERVSNQKSPISNLSEIILSLNTTPDGEHTATIVKDALNKLFSQNHSLHQSVVTVLGRGLSTGAELEYADSETIKNALSNRK